MQPRVLFYVQHLLGIGHFKRTLLIARALAAAGAEPHVLAGGPAVPHFRVDPAVRLIRLPAVRSADESFTGLVDEQGDPLDERAKARRRDLVLSWLARIRPRVLVVESFPFGRRQLRFELLPLLEAARRAPRPRIVCSVRDILQVRRDPERSRETVELVQRFFDHVLVHGDPRFVRLEETFPAAPALADRMHYTGLVAEPAERFELASGREAPSGVLVSAGGGAVGHALLAAALHARRLTRLQAAPWHLLAGPNLGAGALAALAAMAPHGVSVERARNDFPELLAGCAVSVSQAGYNTVGDVLRAGTRAVLVPFEGRGESEQRLRAARLAKHCSVQVVAERELTAQRLAAAVDAALQGPPLTAGLDLEGATRSAQLIAQWAAAAGREADVRQADGSR